MLPTILTSIIRTRYPIIQGGMAYISDTRLASAVSNAGGLGVIASGHLTGEELRAEVKAVRKLTKNPFGVNIMLRSPNADFAARVVIEEKVPVVTTGAGSPSAYIKEWLTAGITVIPVVASAAHAKLMERRGASAVIAEGSEAGGHVGELTTMTLLPQVVDCVNIPVVAAGGISDGRQAAAAFVLGAAGIQAGTKFLTAKECNVHENYKKRILSAKDIDSIVIGKTLGCSVRCLKTSFSRKILELENAGKIISAEDFIKLYREGFRRAAINGDEENGLFIAGQAAGMIKAEQTTAEIVGNLLDVGQ